MADEIKKKVAHGIKQKIKVTGWSIVKTAALSAAVTAGVSSAFPAIGFTNGIVASSIMSVYHQNYCKSKTYFSPLSLAKKAGVKGLVVVTKVGMSAATVATMGIYSVCKSLWNKSKKKENEMEISKDLKEANKCCSDEEDNEEKNEILKIENALNDTEWVNIQCEEQSLVILS